MILPDEETLSIIEMLISQYVPPCLDKTNVLDKLRDINKISLVQVVNPCPKCAGEMVCVKCGDFDVYTHADVDVTVKLNGKTIYG